MGERQQVLVVAPTFDIAQALIAQLAPKHSVTVVPTFEAANAQLQSHHDLLITELKLGKYNGLQLALRVQADGTPAIVIGSEDTAWEREAHHLGVSYLDTVINESRVAALVNDLLNTREKARHA